MEDIVEQLYSALHYLGGFGLVLFGALDSSILFLPLGNDLLLVGMTAHRPVLLPYYAAMAAAGSVLGCLITDVLARKGGEEGLAKKVPRRRLEYVKKKVKKNAGWALAFASLMPPPFPFTPFVAAAAALQYPRKKLLTVIALARLTRFGIEGMLAILFGNSILRLATSEALRYAVMALFVISIVGSAFSIYQWVKRSGNTRAAAAS